MEPGPEHDVRGQRLRRALGVRIERLRRLRGWRQADLAARAGMHRTYIGAVERGERNISLENLDRLAASLGVSIAELFSDLSRDVPDEPAPTASKSAAAIVEKLTPPSVET